MSKFGLIIFFIAAISTCFWGQRDALAQDTSKLSQQEIEGPQKGESTNTQKIDTQSQLRSQTTSYSKDSVEYNGYRHLRNAGIALSVFGGAMVIAGVTLTRAHPKN